MSSGLPVAESEELLDELWGHMVQEKYTWRQEWQVGDLIWWDNRCAMHRRDAFDPLDPPADAPHPAQGHPAGLSKPVAGMAPTNAGWSANDDGARRRRRSCGSFADQARRRRRRMAPSPNSALPRIASEAGSGTVGETNGNEIERSAGAPQHSP